MDFFYKLKNISGGQQLRPARPIFFSKEKDIESSLGDFGVRKYDEEIGRFTSIDPLWEKYLGWNPYHYCRNNPVIRTDRTGYDEASVFYVFNSIKPNLIEAVNMTKQTGKEYGSVVHSSFLGFTYKSEELVSGNETSIDIDEKLGDKANNASARYHSHPIDLAFSPADIDYAIDMGQISFVATEKKTYTLEPIDKQKARDILINIDPNQIQKTYDDAKSSSQNNGNSETQAAIDALNCVIKTYFNDTVKFYIINSNGIKEAN